MSQVSSSASDIFVVIAAFNEGKSIGGVVRGLLPMFPTVVVIDDGSLDDTADQAQTAGAVVLVHPVNLGQGAALQTGITYAVRNNASYVVTFDADGQHDPADIEPMIEALKKSRADIALGSRFLGKAVGINKKKELFLKAAILYTKLTTGLRLTDTHNGLRVFTYKGAKAIYIRQNRMAHASEILEEVASKQLAYIECPVTITYTEYSISRGQKLSNSGHVVIDLLINRLIK